MLSASHIQMGKTKEMGEDGKRGGEWDSGKVKGRHSINYYCMPSGFLAGNEFDKRCVWPSSD